MHLILTLLIISQAQQAQNDIRRPPHDEKQITYVDVLQHKDPDGDGKLTLNDYRVFQITHGCKRWRCLRSSIVEGRGATYLRDEIRILDASGQTLRSWTVDNFIRERGRVYPDRAYSWFNLCYPASLTIQLEITSTVVISSSAQFVGLRTLDLDAPSNSDEIELPADALPQKSDLAP